MSKRWSTLTRAAVALAALAVIRAPGLAAQEADPAPNAFNQNTEAVRKPVRLYVENNNWLDVEVYAVRGSARIRLGTVRSQQGRYLEIPVRATESGLHVQLMADPVGSRESLTTESVMVNPGDVVEWRLQNHLALSSLAVWST